MCVFYYMCVMNGNSFDYDDDAEGCQDDAIVCYCVVYYDATGNT